VVFTHLAAMRLRRFDGVVIAGGDAAHLPGADPLALFFNQGVRAELGLPTRADELREIEARLVELIAASGCITVTWQRIRDGEESLLSPYFERLETLHRCAWNETLVDRGFEACLPSSRLRSPLEAELPAPSAQPRPVAPAPLIPAAVSASGYNSLVACPYQFYARYVLGLRELDEVQEEIEKADYGQRVHAILARFHRDHPLAGALGAAAAGETLVRYSEQAFRDVIAVNFLDAAWLARWRALIPDYVEWQLAREAEGWRFAEAELKREIEITTPEGRTLRLRGQLDRIDVRAGGQAEAGSSPAAVIDYKTRNRKTLQEAAADPGEDVQLPVYALLWGGPVAAALFLSIDRDGVAPVAMADDISGIAEAVRARLTAVYDALHGGARLPAQGIDAVCQYCEMRGLCRRNFWP
jgi:ATP-dependent helicase/nuclease subunit B